MRRSMLALSALVFAPCLVASLPAQVRSLESGTRIRVTLGGVGTRPFIAVVDTVRDDTITVRTSDEANNTIPLDQVWRLEVSQGRKRPMWAKTAPLWMPIAAAGAGAILGYSTESKDAFFGRGFAAMVAGGMGGVAGLVAGVGTAIGVKTEHWKTVPSASRPQVATVAPRLYVAPGAHGLKLGVRSRFR